MPRSLVSGNDSARPPSSHQRRARFSAARDSVQRHHAAAGEHPAGFRAAVEQLAARVEPLGADAILAIEARGFVFGAALAQRLSLPLQLVRKRGKLPRPTLSIEYALEYGVDRLEVHTDAIAPGGRYLIIDDLIATGGTAAAVAQLREAAGRNRCGLRVRGRARISARPSAARWPRRHQPDPVLNGARAARFSTIGSK